jgi:hypothetical protein
LFLWNRWKQSANLELKIDFCALRDRIARARKPAKAPTDTRRERCRGPLGQKWSLSACAHSVSAEDREVDLVYYHEKCVDEVAHILEARRAVKTRMFYARKKKLAPLGHWG